MYLLRVAFFAARLSIGLAIVVSVSLLIEQYAIWAHHVKNDMVSDKRLVVDRWEVIEWYVQNTESMDSVDFTDIQTENLEVYLVDQNQHPVTSLINVTRKDSQALVIATRQVAKALSGNYGVGVSVSYYGDPVLVAYGPVHHNGSTYALIVESRIYPTRLGASPWWYHIAEIFAVFTIGTSIFLILYIEAVSNRAAKDALRKAYNLLAEIPTTDNRYRPGLLCQAMDRANTFVVVFTPTGEISMVSPAVTRLFKQTQLELEKTNIQDWLSPKTAAAVTRTLHRLEMPNWTPMNISVTLTWGDHPIRAQDLTLNVHRLVFSGKVYGVAVACTPFTLDRNPEWTLVKHHC